MGNKITKTIKELWIIAQEINKKELSKDKVCKKYGLSSRTFTELIKNTPIYYKSNKEGYVFEETKLNVIKYKRQQSEEPIEQIGEKRVGRPRKYSKEKTELKKLTLEINREVYNALQFKKINEGLVINKYIEDLLRKNIDKIYFSMVNKLNN
ncbi:hypothetical protein [Clostridium botulinum]|uniref:hypothetical protein n=1 Tax=Clostridium botulinum TaxID=1491 RepID=UPI001E4624AF|nr:hypothetical protein [Clostridium botulinum]MCD3232428.1 hypothetical protein [Clostridium botulinum C/D]